MKPCAVKKVVVVIVDEPVAYAEEFIEALFLRTVITMSTKMPFTEERSTVTGLFKHLSQRHLLERHIYAFGRIHITLRPVHHTTTLWMATGQQRRPRWATNCV